MIRIFFDANVFIRFLIKDDHKKADDARKLFELIEQGKIKAETSVIVLAEIVWVLHSFCRVEKKEISEYISLLVDLKNLLIKDKEIINRAVEIFKNHNIDFIDAFCASLAMKNKIKYICSYEKDFDRIEGVKRIEPSELI